MLFLLVLTTCIQVINIMDDIPNRFDAQVQAGGDGSYGLGSLVRTLIHLLSK